MDDNAASQNENQQTALFQPVEVQVGSIVVVAQTVLEEKVWNTLKECYDPEIPVNIVDLGLVYDMKVDDEIPGEANVFVLMTLTAPGCGMGPMIAADVRRRVTERAGSTKCAGRADIFSDLESQHDVRGRQTHAEFRLVPGTSAHKCRP